MEYMSEYKMTVGLEIHAELKTQTKMFCGCINSGEDSKSPNAFVCPVCMGYPGTLPVINKAAIKKVLSVGVALNSQLADFTEFDRKNYFYPDIPKGYQISQYKFPLVVGGELAGVAITRIHLEEDTAKSSHDTPGVSLVDYNRAGVPLMELVTEPVISSSEQAMKFAQELQLLLRTLGVSGANMEKGEMRVEVNISVSKTSAFGTKVEVKNINSFRAAGKAIDFEYARQVALLEAGEKVMQETRGWDENKSITFSQRSKENAHDYRYFPDPDLPKIIISEIPDLHMDTLKAGLPELPWEKRLRFVSSFALKTEDIEMYVTNSDMSNFFEAAVSHIQLKESGDKTIFQTVSNYITSDLVGLSKTRGASFNTGKVSEESFAGLVHMIQEGKLSSRGGKDVLKILFEEGGSAEKIALEKNLMQKNDPDELRRVLDKIINDNPKIVEEYKAGKESVIQFFVGQGMKEMKGAGNPEMIKSMAIELLK